MEKKLDIFYGVQFVQNESTSVETGNTQKSVYSRLRNGPILDGTMTGTAYRKEIAVATFVFSPEGEITIVPIGSPEIVPINGSLDCKTGRLELIWNKPPKANQCVVSYEYYPVDNDLLPSYCTREEVLQIVKDYMGYDDSPKSVESKPKNDLYPACTFEKFFTSDQLAELRKTAETKTHWDMNTAYGDTIMEKYESLYVKLVEVSNILEKKGAVGYLWIACSPEVSSLFETATRGFEPNHEYYSSGISLKGQLPIGYVKSVDCCGVISAKWRLFKDRSSDLDEILVGVNDTEQKPEHYAVIKLHNYLI